MWSRQDELVARRRSAGIWSAPAVAACPGLSAVGDERPEGGQLGGCDAGRAQDGVPSVDELGGVDVAVAGRGPGGEGKVRGDQPEGNEGYPEHRAEHVVAGGWLIQSGWLKIRSGLHHTTG